MNNIWNIVLFVTVVSCSPQVNRFENEDNIKRYLSEIQNIDINRNLNVFFLQNGNCGSCEERTINLINSLASTENDNVIVLLRGEDKILESKLDMGNVYYDKNWSLEKLGLDYQKDLFVKISNATIVYYNWLYLSEIDNIIAFVESEKRVKL